MNQKKRGVVEQFVFGVIAEVRNVVFGIVDVVSDVASCVVQVGRNAIDAVYTDRERAAARDIGRAIGNAAGVAGRAIRTAAVATGEGISRVAKAVAKVVAGAACEFASDVTAACVEFARDVVAIGNDAVKVGRFAVAETIRCVRFMVAVVVTIDFRRDPNAPPVACDDRGVPFAIPCEETANDDQPDQDDEAVRRAA